MKLEVEDLVKACCRGDERAYKQLYDDYAPKMMGVCLRYAADREMAQDILSDGFVKVFTNMSKLRDPRMLPAWIRRVMVNTALNHLRVKREIILGDGDSQNEIVDAPNYDRFDMSRILDAIQQLPPLYRAVFNMRELEGYSHEEIAERLGLQNAYVRLTLTRAKRRLQTLLGKMEDYI